MKLYEYILRRLILMTFVLFAISIILFVLARGLLPPVSAVGPYLRPTMSDSVRLDIAKSLQIATSSCPSWDDFISKRSECIVPLWQQYFAWLSNVLQGNWGFSQLPGISENFTTWSVFVSRFPYTAQLAILSGLLVIALGIPLGVASAVYNNRLPDHLSRVAALTGYSMPSFWFGFILQILVVLYLAVHGLQLLPSNGALATRCVLCISSPGQINTYTGLPILDALVSGNFGYFWDSFLAIVLPTLTLSITTVALLSRITRSSMMDVLRQDYILLARSKGLKERVVIYRHALRNSLLPAATVMGLIFSSLLGGVVVVENVFAYPGIGSAALSATFALDINFLELYTLATAVIIIVTNLIVDVLYAVLDPRIRY